MSSPQLTERANSLVELMDDINADQACLNRTYQRFEIMNFLVSGWWLAYRYEIRPLLMTTPSATLLDIGCGGGDVVRALSRWSKRDGFSLHITGIDSDQRAIQYAKSATHDSAIDFKLETSQHIAGSEEHYDFVISNHLLHHLKDSEVRHLLTDCQKIARRKVLHNDIERSLLAYLTFKNFVAPLFRDTMIPTDGLRSVQRSFTRTELQGLAPEPWRVTQHQPFRLWLILNQASFL